MMAPVTCDIRDRIHVSGDDVLALNFINPAGRYTFRKYYRSGLRSHIFEVLDKTDVKKESLGQVEDGIRMFPRAVPKKIFRIFRHRIHDMNIVLKEIERYRNLLTYLGKDYIAQSEEFMASYRLNGEYIILFCGLQEYVAGEILDPWRLSGSSPLKKLLASSPWPEKALETAIKAVREFVRRIRYMIGDNGYIPDLAGVGNLILTPPGRLKLVDINNIVHISTRSPGIPLDDKGYPACDVSVQVLAILEKEILGLPPDMKDPLFRHFLNDQRKAAVRELERKFYSGLEQRR